MDQTPETAAAAAAMAAMVVEVVTIVMVKGVKVVKEETVVKVEPLWWAVVAMEEMAEEVEMVVMEQRAAKGARAAKPGMVDGGAKAAGMLANQDQVGKAGRAGDSREPQA